MPDNPNGRIPTQNWRWPDGHVGAMCSWCGVAFDVTATLSHWLTCPRRPELMQEQCERDRDDLLAALKRAAAELENLSACYHEEGFSSSCRGEFLACESCQQSLRGYRALIARIEAGK